ncbi:MAG: sigma-70 family RNA polymerase sigma factor, partial [Desulfobacterota bacterium]|nr:sigma-70 family RNA polymerase sigma factor [Thermodesulfobacteriota bacterium]
MQKSEEVLLEEIRNGNSKSFELLIIKYEKPIFNLIFNLVKETDVVSELAQETFLKAFKSIKSFKGNSTFYTWLRRIAINNSINYLNARNQFSLESEIDENNFFRSLGDHKFYTPEKKVLLEETSLAIKEALDSLPDRLRTILI